MTSSCLLLLLLKGRIAFFSETAFPTSCPSASAHDSGNRFMFAAGAKCSAVGFCNCGSDAPLPSFKNLSRHRDSKSIFYDPPFQAIIL